MGSSDDPCAPTTFSTLVWISGKFKRLYISKLMQLLPAPESTNAFTFIPWVETGNVAPRVAPMTMGATSTLCSTQYSSGLYVFKCH